jgi:4-hydroxy-3-methylbut-2-enyl diphosphate reductase
VLVQEVIARLKELGADSVHEAEGIQENVVFPLPKALTEQARTG